MNFWKSFIQETLLWKETEDLERTEKQTKLRKIKKREDARKIDFLILEKVFGIISFRYLSGIFCFVHFF
jgi:hypothetical protein